MNSMPQKSKFLQAAPCQNTWLGRQTLEVYVKCIFYAK